MLEDVHNGISCYKGHGVEAEPSRRLVLIQASQHRNFHFLVPLFDARLPRYESIGRALSQDFLSLRLFLSALTKFPTIRQMMPHLMRL